MLTPLKVEFSTFFNPSVIHYFLLCMFLALIKLMKPFRQHKFRQVIPRMPDPMLFEEQYQDKKLTVLGWGTLRSGFRLDKLQQYQPVKNQNSFFNGSSRNT